MISISDSIASLLNSRQRKTLEKLISPKTPSDLTWGKVKSLLTALGGEHSSKGRTSGSRLAVTIRGRILLLHERNPLLPYQVNAIVKFLIEQGILEDDQ